MSVTPPLVAEVLCRMTLRFGTLPIAACALIVAKVMKARRLILCAVFLTAAACSGRNPAAPDAAAGQFVMIGFDGSRNLPCCSSTDSSGVVVALAGGVLQIGWNTPPGAYTWDIIRTYDYPNGTSTQAQLPFSTGSYRLDGATLTLSDSKGGFLLTGSIAGNIITLGGGGHTYQFLRLIEMPH